jgi:AraC-like DNA-binding protein
LSGYLELSQSLGLDPEVLLRAVGIDPADLAIPDKWVPAARVARLLEMSARESGHDNFGLRLAEFRALSTLGPLGLVLRDEASLRSAMDLLMRYEHSYNEALRMRMSESNGLATIRMWFEFGEPAPTRQAEELAVAALHGIIREFLGAAWHPLTVCFAHAAPHDLAKHTALLGGKTRFGHDFTGIVFYAKDLDAPTASPTAASSADTLHWVAAPKGATTSDRVKDLVEVLLPTGRCSADETARALGVDRRTLHRHLLVNGETFSSIVDTTRAGLAERYLANNRYRLTEISQLLGFAAPSAFTRWFRTQFGESPSRWRSLRTELPHT